MTTYAGVPAALAPSRRHLPRAFLDFVAEQLFKADEGIGLENT